MLNFRGRGGREDSRFQYHAMRGRFGGRRGGGNDFGGFGGGGFDGDDFGGGGRFGGGPFGGRGGRRRMFDAAELRLVLLKLINDEPRHGYDLIKAIDDLTGGAYAPSPGVVYPTLTLLQDMGQIVEKESDGNKRLFGITEAGTAAVVEQQATVDGLIARLSSLGEESSENDRSPVRRAMFNLHMALKARMFARGRTPELAHEIAAILDEATRKIERL